MQLKGKSARGLFFLPHLSFPKASFFAHFFPLMVTSHSYFLQDRAEEKGLFVL